MKRKLFNQLITGMLLITMVLGNVIPANAEAGIGLDAMGSNESESTVSGNTVSENTISENEEILDNQNVCETQSYVGEGYEVLFEVDNQWEDAFNGSMTITNTSEEVIDNWMIEFNFGHEITNIWNAKICNYSNGKYVIKNDNWNQDINPGESVNFGFQATCQGEIVAPVSCNILGSYQPVVSEVYTVEYIVDSAWGTQANATIKITNHSAEVIEDWQLAFHMNAEITNIWNGFVVTSANGEYLIKNAGYNANINPGESVSFGFQTIAQAGQSVIVENYILKEVTVNKEHVITNDSDEEVGTIYFKNLQSSDEILYDGEGVFYTKNQILLTAKNEVTFGQVQDIVWDDGAQIVGYIELTNDYQIEYNHTLSLEQLQDKIEQYQANEMFEFVSLNTILAESTDAVTTNDASYYTDPNDTWSETNPSGKNQNLEVSKVLSAWEYICDVYGYSSAEDMKNNMNTVRLGVMDSEFDFTHLDLKEIKGKVWNNPEPGTYSENHGTHVAGILSADFNNNEGISSIAINKELYAYSMLGKNDSNRVKFDGTMMSKADDPVPIMEYKYGLSLLIGHNAKVINMSLNTGKLQGCAATRGNTKALNYIDTNANIMSQFLQKMLNTGHDFLICIAAGNSYYNDYELYAIDSEQEYGIALFDVNKYGPQGMKHLECDARYNNILSAIVESSIKNRIIVVGNISDIKENSSGLYPLYESSGRGDRMDVAAIGTNVYSSIIDGSYGYLTGTSMSTPHVASLAGLIHEINPALSGKQIKEIIVDNADGYIYDCTKKYINALASVEETIATTGYTPPVAAPSGIVLGQLTDVVGNGIGNGVVTAYKYDTGDGNLGGEDISGILTIGGQKNSYYTYVNADENGEFELVLTPGIYYLNIVAEGYKSIILFDIKVESEETQYIEQVLMIEENPETNKKGIVQGYIKNALNGNAISGANVIFRKGWNNRYGDVSSWWVSDTTATSNVFGYYSDELTCGNYTAEISMNGYIVGYANIVVSDVSNTIQQNVVLTPILPEDEYRIVLQWGSSPSDLDSHITGPTETGSRFHVYFSNKQYKENGEVVARLDVDDTSSYGPETITMTLKPDLDGVYRYSVHDYSNRYVTNSKALSLSGAKVMLYRGNELLETYNVPINMTGNLWTVFEIEDNMIISKNKLSYISSYTYIP